MKTASLSAGPENSWIRRSNNLAGAFKGFADSEAEPDPDVVNDQLALRRAELAV